MVNLLQTLVLIAGLLWSSVCVAQCRVGFGKSSKQHSTEKQVPPCHQKQQQQQDCKDDGCTVVNYADSEKAAADLSSAVLFDSVATPLEATPPTRFRRASGAMLGNYADRPPDSIFILRI